MSWGILQVSSYPRISSYSRNPTSHFQFTPGVASQEVCSLDICLLHNDVVYLYDLCIEFLMKHLPLLNRNISWSNSRNIDK